MSSKLQETQTINSYPKNNKSCQCSLDRLFNSKNQKRTSSPERLESCRICCQNTKWTLGQLFTVCEEHPECLINMYRISRENDQCLPEILITPTKPKYNAEHVIPKSYETTTIRKVENSILKNYQAKKYDYLMVDESTSYEDKPGVSTEMCVHSLENSPKESLIDIPEVSAADKLESSSEDLIKITEMDNIYPRFQSNDIQAFRPYGYDGGYGPLPSDAGSNLFPSVSKDLDFELSRLPKLAKDHLKHQKKPEMSLSLLNENTNGFDEDSELDILSSLMEEKSDEDSELDEISVLLEGNSKSPEKILEPVTIKKKLVDHKSEDSMTTSFTKNVTELFIRKGRNKPKKKPLQKSAPAVDIPREKGKKSINWRERTSVISAPSMNSRKSSSHYLSLLHLIINKEKRKPKKNKKLTTNTHKKKLFRWFPCLKWCRKADEIRAVDKRSSIIILVKGSSDLTDESEIS